MSSKYIKIKCVEVVYVGKGQIVSKDVVRVRFHHSVAVVEKEAFKDCKQLKEVVLNDGLQKIGEEAFRGCNNLLRINLSTVTEIDSRAFYECNNLKKIILSEGLKKIASRSFYDCRSLESITLPSTITEIEMDAFNRCTRLKELVLNEGIKHIGCCAFANCHSLQRISIPSTLIGTKNWVFENCKSLREVEVVSRDGTPNLGIGMFARCTALERIKFPGISSRLNSIPERYVANIDAKIDGLSLVERSNEMIFVPVTAESEILSGEHANARGRGSYWKTVQQNIDEIISWIRFYEMKEGTVLFELALWKAKIDQIPSSWLV